MARSMNDLCHTRSPMEPSGWMRDTMPAGNISICLSEAYASRMATAASRACEPYLLMGRNTVRRGITFISMSFTKNWMFSSPYLAPNTLISPMPSRPPRGWLEANMKRPCSGMFSSPSTSRVTLKKSYIRSQNSEPVEG